MQPQMQQQMQPQYVKSLNKYNIDEKTFANKKGIHGFKKSFPPVFHEYICDKTYKFGITTFNNNNNISFWSSLLTLLDTNFIIPYKDDENTQISNFKTKILDEYPSKYHIDKVDIREKLKLEPDNIILQYIVDIFDINFIIFDFKTEKINVMYKNNIMNPMKPMLLFANYMSMWEPIMLNGETNYNLPIIKLVSYNNNFIKKILSSNIYYYGDNRDVIINDNINVIIENEQVYLTTKSELKTNDVFIKPTVPNTKFNKMTKDKLLEHATSLGLGVSNKMLKAQIIELIVNHK